MMMDGGTDGIDCVYRRTRDSREGKSHVYIGWWNASRPPLISLLGTCHILAEILGGVGVWQKSQVSHDYV